MRTSPKSRYTAPACRFCIIKIFQFDFFTNAMASPHDCWLFAGVLQLKRVKRISVIFRFNDLKWISTSSDVIEIKGYYIFLSPAGSQADLHKV